MTPDGYLILEGWINNNSYNEFQKSSFRKRFLLPNDVVIYAANLTSDGFLIISGHLILDRSKSTSWQMSSENVSSPIIDVTNSYYSQMISSQNSVHGFTRNENILNPKTAESDLINYGSKSCYDAYMYAVKKILDTNKCCLSTDFMTDYRTFRQSALTQKTQAWCVCEDKDDYLVSAMYNFIWTLNQEKILLVQSLNL